MEISPMQLDRAGQIGRRDVRRTGNAYSSGGIGFKRQGPRSEEVLSGSNSYALSLPVFLFSLSLIIPWNIQIGSIRMSVYRILLTAMLLPCIGMWALGKAGRIRTADLFVVAFCAWGTISVAVVQGASQAIQPSGILLIETLGPYLLARCFVRTADDFAMMVRIFFWTFLLLLPFALHETVTGAKPLLDLFRTVFPVVDVTMMTPRLGFWRVQGPFDHSILFGVNCGCILALVHLVLGDNQSFPRRWTRTGIVIFTACLSLSSGAMTAIAAQGMLLLWNWTLRGTPARWKILLGLLMMAYVFIAFASNQSVPAFYISRFSFDQQSAGFRLLIWYYGSDSVMSHPWFGVGFGEWLHPKWMPPSIDMFWLVNAVRYGIPGGFLMMAAFFAAFLGIGFKTGVTGRNATIRTAWMIVMTGFFMVGWTVHFWNSTYVLFLFLLGSGMWLLDAANGEVEAGDRHPSARRAPSQARVRTVPARASRGTVPARHQ